jgi:hypothetical protein
VQAREKPGRQSWEGGVQVTPGLTNQIVAPRGDQEGRRYAANERFFTQEACEKSLEEE